MQDDKKGPQPGTWAFTAWEMSKTEPDFDWDAWKDEQKEREMFEQDQEDQS